MKLYVIVSTKLAKMVDTEHVILPSTTGLVGVFDNHSTLVTGLEPGLLVYNENGKWGSLVVSPGVAIVKKGYTFSLAEQKKEYVFTADVELEKKYLPKPNDTCVVVLVKGVEFADTIDPDQALAEYTEAQIKLANVTTKKERIQAKYNEKLARARYKATKEVSFA